MMKILSTLVAVAWVVPPALAFADDSAAGARKAGEKATEAGQKAERAGQKAHQSKVVTTSSR